MSFEIMFLFFSISNSQISPNYKGLPPHKVHKYKTNIDWNNGKFRCFDGKKLIETDKINDDFADCKDKSDEPSTLANSEGLFYCQNTGYFPKYIQKWSVDDGICDCCDGSDEPNPRKVNCSNNCNEMNQKYLNIRETLLKRMKKGLNNVNPAVDKSSKNTYYWLSNKINKNKEQNKMFEENNSTENSETSSFLNHQKQLLDEKFKSEKTETGKSISTKFSLSNGHYKLENHASIRHEGHDIGRFARMEGNRAIYNNGEHCWIIHRGKNTYIDEYCWDTNVLQYVVEFSMCEYKGVLLTDTACNKETIDKVENMSPEEIISLAKIYGIE